MFNLAKKCCDYIKIPYPKRDEIIVFDNYNAIFNMNKINLNNYCSIYSSDNYNVYVDKKITNQC